MFVSGDIWIRASPLGGGRVTSNQFNGAKTLEEIYKLVNGREQSYGTDLTGDSLSELRNAASSLIS